MDLGILFFHYSTWRVVLHKEVWITEWQKKSRLEETSPSPNFCWKQILDLVIRALRNQVLNISIEEDSFAFLGNWFQCLIVFTVKHMVYIQVEFLLNAIMPIVPYVFSLFILVKEVSSLQLPLSIGRLWLDSH